MDHKDLWCLYYEEAIDEGLNEEDASQKADDRLYDLYASRADCLMMYEKYGDLA